MNTGEQLVEVETRIIEAAWSDEATAHDALREAQRLAALYHGHACLPSQSEAGRKLWLLAAERMSGIAAAIANVLKDSAP